MNKCVLVGALLLATSASADKASREFMKNELAPAIKAAEAKLKAACGCAIKINATASIANEAEMRTSKHVVGSITDGAAAFCSDAPSKKAVCQMRTLDLAKTAETKFSFKAGKGTAATDGNSYVSWDMITKELDKDGKAERAFMNDELMPAVKKAAAALKSSCGCDVKITVTPSIARDAEMRTSKHVVSSIADEAPKYCTDTESKKAICQLKSLDLVKAKETAFTFKAGKGTAATDANSYVSWDMIAREIDK